MYSMIADYIIKLKGQTSTHTYLITSYLLCDNNWTWKQEYNLYMQSNKHEATTLCCIKQTASHDMCYVQLIHTEHEFPYGQTDPGLNYTDIP